MSEPAELDPILARRRLTRELKGMREARELTQPEVASALDWSPSKLVRIETGAVGISVSDLRSLLNFYVLHDPALFERLLGDARQAKKSTWWTKYRALHGKAFIEYLGLESSAVAIDQYQPLLIPGLLQTEEYMEAVLPQLTPEWRKEQLIAARMERQEQIFDRQGPMRISFVIDEAAVRRWVGGARVMIAQLRRIKEMGQRDNVDVQILPFSQGQHPGLNGGFTLLELPDNEFVLYVENPRGDIISHSDPEEAAASRSAFLELSKLSSESSQLDSVIDRLIEDFDASSQVSNLLLPSPDNSRSP